MTNMTALELGKKIKAKEISALEATRAALERIKRMEPALNSFITVDEVGALKQAQEVQKKIESGELSSALAGVPAAIKDNLCVEGMPATCASKTLSDFMPSYTAQSVLNLKRAGAVILGKTNMDEMSMGGSTQTSFYGPTKNPQNLAHVPGGSSGGSAAAVAAEECFYSLGTDTGGSIRQPGAFCGVTGFKPTHGSVSRHGMIASSPSLDQIGPMAKDVSDCAAILEVISSYCKKDGTSILRKDYDPMSALVNDVAGMRIGLPKSYFGEGLAPEIESSVLDAAKSLERKGANVKEVEMDLLEYALPAYFVLAFAEASSSLVPCVDGFGYEVKRRVLLGTFFLSPDHYDADYRRAVYARARIKQEFDKAFQEFDLILTPTTQTTAPKLGAPPPDGDRKYFGDIYTASANLAGLPAISLPCGRDSKGLPIGMQLIGDAFQEKKIIRAAYAYERSRF